jgi:hypothetical protein
MMHRIKTAHDLRLQPPGFPARDEGTVELGRWGEKDELGAANLITPAKRKQALGLAREG